MHDVDLSSAARLVGDPTRAALLTVLLDGRAYTSGELARLVGVAPATASGHLSRLLDGGMVALAAQGRHRYYRLAGPEIASVLESLAFVSGADPRRTLRASSAAQALRTARSCYDHVAGELGVAIHDRLADAGALVSTRDGVELTEAGDRWFAELGVDVAAARSARRPPVRLCLDWTERRYHLAGSLPAALLDTLLDRWVLRRRARGERGLDVTPAGAATLEDALSRPRPRPVRS